jgi:hypothetical protein
MNDTLRDEIIGEISRVFKDVKRGDITLHEAEVIDGC